MPPEQEAFKTAVNDLLRVVIFENWLRFYFIVETEGSVDNDKPDSEPVLKIELPQKSLEQIERHFPDFLPLAQAMNGKTIDFQTSRAAVLTYVMDRLDGKKIARGMAEKIFSSSTFQIRLQLFHTWVQIHEEQLDQGFLDFGKWLQLFGEWEKGPGAKELAAKLSARD